jgi:site-specific recombinase XerD
MSVKIREKRGKLYLDIYSNGRRNWEALHMELTSDKTQNKETMRVAEICRVKRELQVVSGEWGILDPGSEKKTLYLFAKDMANSGKYAVRINSVLPYLDKYQGGKTVQISRITKKWLENFQDFLLEHLSKNTARNYILGICQILNKAVQDNIILRNPGREVEIVKREESERIFLNIEEMQKLADIEAKSDLEKDVKKAFIFACYTGLRVSDLITITWGNIEHNPPQIVKSQKKTGVRVYIPLHKTARTIIDDNALHDHGELIFPWLNVIKNNRNLYLSKWADRANIGKPIGWHTARHTFAVKSLESGADIYTVSKLLGHTDITATQVYAKATDKMKREAVNALPEIIVTSNEQ